MVHAEIARNGACAVASVQPAAPFLMLMFAEFGLSPKAGATFASGGSALIGASNDTQAFILRHS
jgi:hypothetical protein